MQQFMRKFTQLNGQMAKVVLEHRFFDYQVFYCDELQTISDDQRIGVVIKKRKIFMDKQDVKTATVKSGMYRISDGRLTIKIFVQ